MLVWRCTPAVDSLQIRMQVAGGGQAQLESPTISDQLSPSQPPLQASLSIHHNQSKPSFLEPKKPLTVCHLHKRFELARLPLLCQRRRCAASPLLLLPLRLP